MKHLLEVRGLSVGIKRGQGHLMAVNGIDITINAGEIVALAGESGCGKTLTALSIMRLLPPAAEITAGTILFTPPSIPLNAKLDPPPPANAPPGFERELCGSSLGLRGKEIAMVYQEPGQSLNPLMRVGPQIAEALELHGADKKTAAAETLDMLKRLAFPQPEKMFSAWPHQLSGGMRQRVMIAIAAICRPRLLIADEPTSSLDTENQRHILALLRQINAEFGTAILFISHDLGLARDFCSRFMVMYAGHIIEEGPCDELFSAPAHPYTAALIASIPRRENRGRPLASIPGSAPSIEERLTGCPFAPRCPKAKEPCTAELPPWAGAGAGKMARCFFAEAGND
ncbi:MAG: ABC transporter ATP-binding protein [Treponema sp.]|nr:ABC transporter ATP-binding protein [Treponema sp.]